MKILITGGFGYLGSFLADYFYQHGHSLRLFCRSENKGLGEWARRFEVRIGSVTNPGDIDGICDGVDAVFHLAALDEGLCQNNPALALEVNTLGTRNILHQAKNVGRFVYVSTFHVYGRGSGRILETDLPAPQSDYALTHLFAEYYCGQFVMRHGTPTTIVRLTNTYGVPPNNHLKSWHLALNDFCRMAVRSNKIVLKTHGGQKRDFVWLWDVGQAADILLKAPSEKMVGEVLNLGGKAVSIADLARLVKTVYERKSGRDLELVIPPVLDGEKIADLDVSIEKFRALGFAPRECMVEEIEKVLNLAETAGDI